MGAAFNLWKIFETTVARERLLDGAASVCVCLSGGPDSVALLHLMRAYGARRGVAVSACHVNHMLRGAEADRDERFCGELCEKFGLPFFSAKIDVPAKAAAEKKSIELAAREARYAYFDALRQKTGIERFATAHTASDQAETVLFRILRGTTTEGLAGIPYKRGSYIRPLLDVQRRDILRFLEETGASFVTDSTNACTRYTRNYIRETLLPAMQALNPDVTGALTRLSRCAREDADAFGRLLAGKDAGETTALLRRRVQAAYTAAAGGSLCAAHLHAILKLIEGGKNGAVSLPDGYMAEVVDGKVAFSRQKIHKPTSENGIYSLCEGKNRFAGNTVEIRFFKENPPAEFEKENVYNYSTYALLSFDKINGRIQYRSRRPGDTIRVKGVNRRLKKLFSEAKIQPSLRDRIPVFYDREGIFYVPFVAVADRVYRGAGSPAELQAPRAAGIFVGIKNQGPERVVAEDEE